MGVEFAGSYVSFGMAQHHNTKSQMRHSRNSLGSVAGNKTEIARVHPRKFVVNFRAWIL